MKIRIFPSIVAVSLGASSLPASAQDADVELSDILTDALACEVVEQLLVDTTASPIYRQGEGGCQQALPGAAGEWFIDAACTEPLAYQETSLEDHCEKLVDKAVLGEGDGVDPMNPVWTLSPGTRLDVGARELDGVTQPWLQRTIYSDVQTRGGNCRLEMRVYASSPDVEGQGSLIAFHGGSWSHRGFGFFGLEMTVPHFVEQGFVVYVPFYRLLGTDEGSAACNDATIEDIVNDAEAALDWVERNDEQYGSSGKPLVFGQSAGGHLAASLAVNHSERVAGAVLFYAPLDFSDFGERVNGGYYQNTQGLGILERVTGQASAPINLFTSTVTDNSFPVRIAQEGATIAPVFMLQGMADELVEARQSMRLCQAIAQETLLEVDEDIPTVEPGSRRLCGSDSELRLSAQGEHALDVCIANAPLLPELCRSGDARNRDWVAEAIGDAADFARSRSAAVNPTQPGLQSPGSNGGGSGGSSGGGALGLHGLWLLLMAAVLRLGRHRMA